MLKWFSRSWWRYLILGQITYGPRTYWPQKPVWVSSLRHLICRAKGHPCGVVWYTGPLALEPDMSCRNCGDDLG